MPVPFQGIGGKGECQLVANTVSCWIATASGLGDPILRSSKNTREDERKKDEENEDFRGEECNCCTARLTPCELSKRVR